ncbi:DUF4345 domain-containing protein [Actinomadura sp. LOL_016]|uniref:DUF4345 domain-containing protein n=1 Tax=unclassified Actinomadura TaxID=2626254 RepID=UPI003A801BC8
MSGRVNLRSVVLFTAGLVLLVVGTAGLTAPVAFHEASGIEVAADPGLLSETRATGGVLLAAGVFLVLGAFVVRFAVTAAGVGAFGYLAYGLSRLIGIAVDGMPGSGLVMAAAVELSLALACAYVLLRRRGGP